MLVLLNIFWFIWMLKYTLFWLFLWQLKEYHLGRIIDHFRTHKGKKILFSFAQILKLVLLVFLFAFSGLFTYLFVILFLVYVAEVLLFFRNIYLKNFKKPVKTLKSIFLSLVSFAVVILFLNWTFNLKDAAQPAWLLIFDILTPLIISAIVLIFQPFFVFARNNKWKEKICWKIRI